MKILHKRWKVVALVTTIIVVVGVSLTFLGGKGLDTFVTNIEQPADDLLERARQEYENGRYNTARMLLDSIKIVSPKAYKTRREAEILRREVMIKEKERDIVFFEEELQRLVAVKDSLAAQLVFSKDKKYQDKGYYTDKSQAISQNTKNNFLRASVYEDGIVYLTSFYRGKNIKHTTVKLSADEAYVSCDRVFLDRDYKEYGVNNERRDYKYGEDDGLVDFIVAAQGKIEVELTGENGKATYTLRDSDVEAVRKVLEMAQAIKAVQMVEEMLDEANYSLKFLKRSEEAAGDAADENVGE